MSEAILAYARERNVTKIVIGKPRAPPAGSGSSSARIVDALVRGSGEIDIHVISGEGGARPGAAAARAGRRRDWSAYALAAAVVAVATATAWRDVPVLRACQPHHGLSARRRRGGHPRRPRARRCWRRSSASLAFDFFFVPPYLTFAVSDPSTSSPSS